LKASGPGPEPTLPATYELEQVASLPSTSDACIERARAGAPDGLAILADGQTAARGSRGRDWSCPPGNLYLSVLLRPRNPAEEAGAGQWALLAGVSLIEALASFTAAPDALRLKWPNDVVSDGAKLAGILVDAAMAPGGGAEWLVIGVGANLAVAPAIEGRRIAALVTPPEPPPPPALVARVFLARLEAWRGALAHEGFSPVRDAWLRRAHPLGTPVTIRERLRSRTGVFAGLSPQGELLLSAGGTIHTISTGDVLLGQGD
jgi:BirA family transcriptional regulator, biotin operon repressor / biotin---[acetyl-CoA-carboxylase] ligase